MSLPPHPPLVPHPDPSSLVLTASPNLSSMHLPTLSTSSHSTLSQNLIIGEKKNLTDYPDLPPSSPTSTDLSLLPNDSSSLSLTGRSPLPSVTSLIPLIAFALPGPSRICVLELSPQQAFEDFISGSAQRLFSSPHSLRYFEHQSKEQSLEKTSGTEQSSTSPTQPSCPPRPLTPPLPSCPPRPLTPPLPSSSKRRLNDPPLTLPLPPSGTRQPNAPPLHRVIFRPSPLKKSKISPTSSTKTTRRARSQSKRPAPRMTTSTQDVPGSRRTRTHSSPSPSSPATSKPKVEIDLSLLSDSD